MTSTDHSAVLVQLLRTAYDPHTSNDVRQAAVAQLQLMPQKMDPVTYVQVLNSLMVDCNMSMEVRNFAFATAASMVKDRTVSPSQVPYADAAAFLAATSDIPAIVVSGISQLLGACALYVYPEIWPNMFDVICPETLAGSPYLPTALEAVLASVTDPPVDQMERSVAAELRVAIKTAAPLIVQRVVSAVATGLSGSISITPSAVARLIGIIELCLPLLEHSAECWWNHHLDSMVVALLQYSQTAAVGANLFVSMASHVPAVLFPHPQNQKTLSLVTTAAANVHTAASREDWETVEHLLDGLAQLPAVTVRAVAASISTVTSTVLRIPSVFFANIVLELFVKVILNEEKEKRLSEKEGAPASPIEVSTEFVPTDVIELIWERIKKNVSEPTANTPSGAFSAMHFATLETFAQTFASMRGSAQKVLSWLAEQYPQETVQHGSGLVQRLFQLVPGSAEPRTAHGHVTQRSSTFVEWEATYFVIEAIEPAYHKPENSPVIGRFLAQMADPRCRPSDATLVPIYLNIYAAFWPTPYPHWEQSFDVVFHYMTLRSPNNPEPQRFDPGDPDVVSARKRAQTLLIRIGGHYGSCVGHLAEKIVTRAEELLLSGKLMPSETSYLYEALSALSNNWTDEEQRTFLIKLLGPHRQNLLDQAASVTPQRFAELLLAEGRDNPLVDARNVLRESISVISSCLKRCRPSPVVVTFCHELLPQFGSLTMAMQQIQPFFPPHLQSVFSLADTERAALETGKPKKPMADRGSPAGRIRGSIQQLRHSLYSGLGTMITTLQSIPDFLQPLCELMVSSLNTGIQATQLLFNNCLLPSIEAYPPLAVHVLPCLGTFFEGQSTLQRNRPEDDVADARNLSFFYRDIMKVVKKAIIDTNLFANDASIGNSLIAFFFSMIRSGYESRNVFRDLSKPYLSDMNSVNGQKFFALFLQAGVHHPRLIEAERRMVIEGLADLFVNQLGAATLALQFAGVPTEKIEELKSRLLGGPARIDAKRKRFHEFMFQPGVVPSPFN